MQLVLFQLSVAITREQIVQQRRRKHMLRSVRVVLTALWQSEPLPLS